MSKFKLVLLFSLVLGGGKAMQASDFWQVAKNYLYDNSRVLTAAAAIGAALYLLLPDEEASPIDKKLVRGGVPVNNRSRQELAPLLARQGIAALAQNKKKYRNRSKVDLMPVIKEK